MDIVQPDTYSNFIGTVVIGVAMLCLLISFNTNNRSHSTKLFSIMIVASLSFFSSNVTTYFAAIFIVATAVTELEFLQNLAAIIRKDEHYFKYKKEALSREDHIRRKAEEAIEEEYVSDSEINNKTMNGKSIDLSKLQDLSRTEIMRLSFDVEEMALDTLTKQYGIIERGVRFRKNGELVEFDGVLTEKNAKENTVFDVKWTRNTDHFYPFIMHSIRRSNDLISKHEKITGVKPNFNLVIVANTKTSISSDRFERIQEKAEAENISLIVLSLSEIGFDVTHEIT